MSKRLIILITLFFFSIGNSIAGRVEKKEIVEVTIYNLEGEQQYHNQFASPQSFSLQSLDPGLFLMKLCYGNHNIWKKIVIQP